MNAYEAEPESDRHINILSAGFTLAIAGVVGLFILDTYHDIVEARPASVAYVVKVAREADAIHQSKAMRQCVLIKMGAPSSSGMEWYRHDVPTMTRQNVDDCLESIKINTENAARNAEIRSAIGSDQSKK